MTKQLINPKYLILEPFIKDLPQLFSETGETVFAGRNLIKSFDSNGITLNAKSFKEPILINQFVYALLRQSKAERSYRYALKLIEKGFHTPEPVAYTERKMRYRLKQSFYISIQETFDGAMQELRYGKIEGRESLIRQFALFTAKLHSSKVLHLDYSPGNILYKKTDTGYTFYLVDLNRMTFDKEISLEDACYNFRRLWGSDAMIRLFVNEYAKARGFDTETCINKTFAYRKKFWDKFSKKHPGSSPYLVD